MTRTALPLAALALLGTSPLLAAGIKTLSNQTQNLLSKEVARLGRDYSTSNGALHGALEGLGEIRSISDKAQIRETIGKVEDARQLQKRTDGDMEALTGFVSRNREKLRNEGLERLLPLAELRERRYADYHVALQAYLDAFKGMLEYMGDHYEAITAGREQERKEYETRYGRYVSTLETYNGQLAQFQEFMQGYLEKFPELREYLKK